MLRRTNVARGYENWPWPKALPLKSHWYNSLKPNQSIARDVRGVQRAWDLVVVSLLGLLAYRTYSLYQSGAYQTRLKHLNNTAPAIIAQDFDFAEGPRSARHVSRARLDEYRTEYAAAKATGKTVESFIFKY